jgi:hypothetical protein
MKTIRMSAVTAVCLRIVEGLFRKQLTKSMLLPES